MFSHPMSAVIINITLVSTPTKIQQHNRYSPSSSNHTMGRDANKVEAMVDLVVEKVAKEVNNTRGHGSLDLVAFLGQHPEDSLETLFGFLQVLFDSGVIYSFISSQLVDKINLEKFPVNPSFMVTSLLGK